MVPLTKSTSVSISLLLLYLFMHQTGSGQIPREIPREQRAGPILIQNESAGLQGSMAFRITKVQPASPAARADLRVNDLILAVDDAPISSREELEKTLLQQPWLNPGASFVVTFGRFDPQSGRLEVEKRVIQAY